MEASTSSPKAMATPASDMMLALIPRSRRGMKESSTTTGMVMMGIAALGKCHKNTSTISSVKTTIFEVVATVVLIVLVFLWHLPSAAILIITLPVVLLL